MLSPLCGSVRFNFQLWIINSTPSFLPFSPPPPRSDGCCGGTGCRRGRGRESNTGASIYACGYLIGGMGRAGRRGRRKLGRKGRKEGRQPAASEKDLLLLHCFSPRAPLPFPYFPCLLPLLLVAFTYAPPFFLSPLLYTGGSSQPVPVALTSQAGRPPLRETRRQRASSTSLPAPRADPAGRSSQAWKCLFGDIHGENEVEVVIKGVCLSLPPSLPLPSSFQCSPLSPFLSDRFQRNE